MRLWSLHPKYLDSAGLVALWREGLLAQHVLEGKTKGYTNHPQLLRFKSQTDPVLAINAYLYEVLQEAKHRKFNFDATKIPPVTISLKMNVHDGQLQYEFEHLLRKLERRSTEQYSKIKDITKIDAHPLFTITHGEIAEWEIRS